MLDEQDLAALALTSRLVESAAKPLSSREFWALRRSFEPSVMYGNDRGRDRRRNSASPARTPSVSRGCLIALPASQLLWRSWTIRHLDYHGCRPAVPRAARARLRDSAPVVLHGVGDISLLDTDGVGVVGSRDISADGVAGCP